MLSAYYQYFGTIIITIFFVLNIFIRFTDQKNFKYAFLKYFCLQDGTKLRL